MRDVSRDGSIAYSTSLGIKNSGRFKASKGIGWRCYPTGGYPAARRSLGLERHIYNAASGNLIERFVQYAKDRTEGFDDHFPCAGCIVALGM